MRTSGTRWSCNRKAEGRARADSWPPAAAAAPHTAWRRRRATCDAGAAMLPHAHDVALGRTDGSYATVPRVACVWHSTPVRCCRTQPDDGRAAASLLQLQCTASQRLAHCFSSTSAIVTCCMWRQRACCCYRGEVAVAAAEACSSQHRAAYRDRRRAGLYIVQGIDRHCHSPSARRAPRNVARERAGFQRWSARSGGRRHQGRWNCGSAAGGCPG